MSNTQILTQFPKKPLSYEEAIVTTENWLATNILTREQREEGMLVGIFDYHDRKEDGIEKRPWAGVRVAEVSFHVPGRGGGSYMQVDAPWGIAVCGQVERCILALVEGWNSQVDTLGEGYAETDDEFWRLGHLFELMKKED